MKSNKQKYSDEQILERIREFRRVIGRVPTTTDLGRTFQMLVISRFGSWNDGLFKALGVKSKRIEWTDEQLLHVLKSLYIKHHRFPTRDELRSVNSGIERTLTVRFGGLNDAYERALGTSPRLVILSALDELTPPSCNEATTAEICAVLSRKGINWKTKHVGVQLDDFRRAGLVESARVSWTTVWRLTTAGRLKVKGSR